VHALCCTHRAGTLRRRNLTCPSVLRRCYWHSAWVRVADDVFRSRLQVPDPYGRGICLYTIGDACGKLSYVSSSL
jgi:hypothetical protein